MSRMWAAMGGGRAPPPFDRTRQLCLARKFDAARLAGKFPRLNAAQIRYTDSFSSISY